MSWRFRKSFKVLPGVKLNITRRGLSATLGASPFSLNVGPHGVYSNISIPGTGIWNRTRLDNPTPLLPVPSTPVPIAAPKTLEPVHEIRSASTELLNSAALEDLKKLLKETYDERNSLAQEIAAAEEDASGAKERFQSWDRGILLKRLFKRSFEERKQAQETAQAQCEELNEQLRLTAIATEINVEAEVAEQYYRMRDDFAAASESQRIWDTLDRRAVNRVVERSAAHEAITRADVTFSLGTCDLIQWDQKVPHLPNRTGGDLYIYPGFILYRASKQAFALIDPREVTLTHRTIRFIEEEKLPSDTRTVGHAWAKSNKDGSPDRRFRDNYQIPVVLYGSLTFTSPTGLEEEFQLSNADLAERFAKAWDRFHRILTYPIAGEQIASGPVAAKDVASAFAGESELARKLALGSEECREVLLVEELLRSKLTQLVSEYERFDASLQSTPKRHFNEADYIHWLGTKTTEAGPLIERLAECVNSELSNALAGGDPVRLLNAVNRIIERCRDFIRWELEICSGAPPQRFKALGTALRGFSGSVIADIGRLRDEFTKIAEGARKGIKEFNFHLEFSTPPQLQNFTAEMARVNSIPKTVSPRSTGKSFFTKVTGISLHQEAAAQCQEGEQLILVREPDNPKDPGAIKILRENGEQVGYVPAHVSRNGDKSGLAFRIDRGDHYLCRVKDVTGGFRETRGVNIEITMDTISGEDEEGVPAREG